jgi:ribose 1,5-bisphosphokinase PhnN
MFSAGALFGRVFQQVFGYSEGGNTNTGQRGRLFLTVGPSGSGKDSVLSGAQQLAGTGLYFCKRDVTRQAAHCAPLENSVSSEQFDAALDAGE